MTVDTSNERLADLVSWTSDGSQPDTHALLRELQQLRSAKAADRERVGSVVADVIGNELVERKLYIVKPQQPTMGEIALEAYGHGRACDAVALLGDDLQTLLSAMSKRVADELCKP